MGILNPIHTQTKESKINSSIKHSASIKKRISDGSFTPCITNSWASSRCKIYADGKFYRSTWEAVFHILNPMCEYEKIRIPYISPIDNKEHIYMVDFVNFHDRIIYEIKPNSNIHNKVVEAKTESASGWSASNQYKYVIISNEWFMQNAPKIDYTLYDPKIKTGMKQFLHENKKH
jgi:hypothetical protein